MQSGRGINPWDQPVLVWKFFGEIEADESAQNLKKNDCNEEFTFYTYYCAMRVLVAEDRPRMARLLERALCREGHTVTLAFDGEQAIASGRSEDLDVILLDVEFPLVDGFTVLRMLRAEHFTTPTIMVTARDAMTDIVRGLDLGADDYLTKPFSLEVLLARVRAVSRRGPAIQPDTLRVWRFEAQPADVRVEAQRASNLPYPYRVRAIGKISAQRRLDRNAGGAGGSGLGTRSRCQPELPLRIHTHLAAKDRSGRRSAIASHSTRGWLHSES